MHSPNDRPPLRTVLYVEDRLANVVVMRALFAELSGVRLIVATTGSGSWLAAIESRPDLLLLDLILPDCHGSDLLERIRTLPGFASVPAVAVTADESCNLAGTSFQEVWMKPLDGAATIRRIECLLGVSAPEQATPDAPARSPVEPGASESPGPPAVTVNRTIAPSRAPRPTKAGHLLRGAPMSSARQSALRPFDADDDIDR